LGDISRFEPTESGADNNYAKGPQNILRDEEKDGVNPKRGEKDVSRVGGT
jgi:hypothetical protein